MKAMFTLCVLLVTTLNVLQAQQIQLPTVQVWRDCSLGPRTLYASTRSSAGTTYLCGTLGTVGRITTVENGFSWNCIPTQSTLMCIGSSVDTIVTAGEAGVLYYGDGINFTGWSTPFSDTIHALTHSEQEWVLCTSGGEVFTAKSVGAPLQKVYSNQSVGSLRGIAKYKDTIVAVSDKGVLCYSSNNGQTWNEQQVDSKKEILYSVLHSSTGNWYIGGDKAIIYTASFNDTVSITSTKLFEDSFIALELGWPNYNGLLFLYETPELDIYTGGLGWRKRSFFPPKHHEAVYKLSGTSKQWNTYKFSEYYENLNLLTDRCIGVSIDVKGVPFAVTSNEFIHAIHKLERSDSLQEIASIVYANYKIERSTVNNNLIRWQQYYFDCVTIGTDSILVLNYLATNFGESFDSTAKSYSTLELHVYNNGKVSQRTLATFPYKAESMMLQCGNIYVTAPNGMVRISNDTCKTWVQSKVATTPKQPILLCASGSSILVETDSTEEHEPGSPRVARYISTDCGETWKNLVYPALTDNCVLSYSSHYRLNNDGNIGLFLLQIDTTKEYPDPAERTPLSLETRNTSYLQPSIAFPARLLSSGSSGIGYDASDAQELICANVTQDGSLTQSSFYTFQKQDTGWGEVESVFYTNGKRYGPASFLANNFLKTNDYISIISNSQMFTSLDLGKTYHDVYTRSSGSIFGFDKTKNGCIISGESSYLARIDFPKSTSISESTQNLYANNKPVTYQNCIPLQLGKEAKISLYNLNGMLVTTVVHSEPSATSLDISNKVQNGVYAYTIEHENTITKGIVNVTTSTY